MTFYLPLRRMPLAVLAVATLCANGAYAQGTDAQREACASDAVNLCQDTIPDVPKTTACMKAHFTELSPRCQREFSAATGMSRKTGRQHRIAGREDGAPPPPAVAPAPAETGAVDFPSADTLGMSSYEAQIRDECRQGLIDPFTCRNTLDLLHGVE